MPVAAPRWSMRRSGCGSLRHGVAISIGLVGFILFTSPARAADSDRHVFVQSLAASGSDVFAVEKDLRCKGNCVRLRMQDSTNAWVGVPGKGWGQGPVLPYTDGLLSVTQTSIVRSVDRGASFTPLLELSGSLSVRSGSGNELEVGISGTSGAHLYRLPQGTLQSIQIDGLTRPRVTLNPAKAMSSADPRLFVTGQEPREQLPVLSRCSYELRCDAPTPILSVRDSVELTVSPNFADDATLFARTGSHGLLQSSDGGRTFAPAVLGLPQGAIVSVRGLQLTPTFDARTRQGSVYAALFYVVPATGDTGRVAGGVYAMDGDARWEQLGPGSPLDRGTTAITLMDSGLLYASWLQLPSSGGTLCWTGRQWSVACRAAAAGGAGTAATAPSSSSRPVAAVPSRTHMDLPATGNGTPDPISSRDVKPRAWVSSGLWIASGGALVGLGLAALLAVRRRRRTRPPATMG